MTAAEETAALRAYVARWRAVAPLIDAQRDEDVRRADTVAAIAIFGRLGNDALQRAPARPDSGLVEQQRLFLKLRPA